MFSSNASQVSSDANYIEDVFSTWLYTGNGSTQTITNGIDLAGEGGLVWIKSRSAVDNNRLFDTSRGATKVIYSDLIDAQATAANSLTAFNSNGFSLGSLAGSNTNGTTYASWTFREQSKFFDVVTWTGDGTNRTIAHNLGSVPGCIIVKSLNAAGAWQVYHRSLANTEYMVLNTTAAKATGATRWNSTTPTSTEFSLGTDITVNGAGRTFIAYLFAHDAGGFGESGEDNVISCGSFTTDGSGNATVNLGYEPQWVLYKHTAIATDWNIFDNMRGMPVGSQGLQLKPNSTAADNQTTGYYPTSTGFQAVGLAASQPQIYIAIRRGPMKTPTTGTSVFDVDLANPGNSIITTTFPVDLNLGANRAGSAANFNTVDRLRGGVALRTSATDAEQVVTVTLDSMNSFSNAIFGSGNHVFYSYKRAPGFMDVVCYTGTGSLRTVSHNLAAAPDLMIIKSRNGTRVWRVYSRALTANAELNLNSTAAVSYSATNFNNTDPTSSVFTVNTNSAVNAATDNYVAYLFASCPGVSKVTNFTGTGALQTINCGFTSGSRFVLIKRTDSTGDWYVWDSSRGLSSSTDPYLLLNSTAAEVTSTNWVDTTSTGFQVTAEAGNNVNINGASYIALAIS